jgi:hypothetical protein
MRNSGGATQRLGFWLFAASDNVAVGGQIVLFGNTNRG